MNGVFIVVNKRMIRNKLRAFAKKHVRFLWYIKDRKNDEKLLQVHAAHKKMTLDERINFVSSRYEKRVGKPLNLDNPTDYTEKIQWRKLFEQDSRMQKYTDKVQVREWVKEKIGSEYLIPVLGIYDSFDEIPFEELPDRFVLKTNHAAGWNMIVTNKKKFDKKYAKRKFDMWLSLDYAYIEAFEMHYSGIKPKIICEEYIEDETGALRDYKFLCFGGKPYYCWVDSERFENHTRNIYDLEWNLQPWRQKLDNYREPIPKPKNFDKMVEIAGVLCAEFEHIRIDLYNVDGKIYFGETTFTNGSGYDPIIPDSFDRVLGDMWNLSVDI